MKEALDEYIKCLLEILFGFINALFWFVIAFGWLILIAGFAIYFITNCGG
jgi:hypothetical protein